MALQDGGSLKQDVVQAPSSLQAGRTVGTGERGLCSWSRAMPERFPASTLGGSASWAREPAWSDLIGWRFKTAAHSSKMLTKRHRLYRLAGQLAQAREGFAVAPGPCPSGSPPLLMAAARAGLVSQRGSDLSGWRFKTAAHSSKMLSKRHRLYRLAGQLAQAREGFAVGPGPCLSGSPPLLLAAARAGLVSQRGVT